MRSIPKDADRCEFVSSDGRRCCMLRVEPGAPFCFDHWKRHQEQEESARTGDEIVGADGALNTQEGIHKALANVFCNLARNRISARNAAVLGYVGQLMLGSAPSIERTIKSFLPALQLLSKIKQQTQEVHSDEPLYKMALDEFEVTKRLIEQFNTFDTMSTEERERFAKFIATFLTKREGPASA